MRESITLDRKRWWVLAAACLINLCIGSLYVWSVFALPLAEKFTLLGGKSVDAISLAVVFTVSNVVVPIGMIAAAFINDYVGHRWILMTGSVVFGSAFVLSGFANNIAELVFSYGVLGGIGMGLLYGITVNNAIKFFPDKKGLVGGIVTAAYCTGGIVIAPLAQLFINHYGISFTFLVLGIAFFGIIFIGSFFMEKPPVGYMPAKMVVDRLILDTFSKENMTWKEMLKQRSFYVMLFMFFAGSFAGMMILSETSFLSIQVMKMNALQAATMVSLISVFNMLGRVVAGHISDKHGRMRVVQSVFIISIIGTLLLMGNKDSIFVFAMAISLIGFCLGSFIGIYPAFTAERFGIKYNTVNYSLMFLGFSLSGFLAPLIAGKIVTRTENYFQPYMVALDLLLLGLVVSFALKDSKKKKTISLPAGVTVFHETALVKESRTI